LFTFVCTLHDAKTPVALLQNTTIETARCILKVAALGAEGLEALTIAGFFPLMISLMYAGAAAGTTWYISSFIQILH